MPSPPPRPQMHGVNASFSASCAAGLPATNPRLLAQCQSLAARAPRRLLAWRRLVRAAGASGSASGKGRGWFPPVAPCATSVAKP